MELPESSWDDKVCCVYKSMHSPGTMNLALARSWGLMSPFISPLVLLSPQCTRKSPAMAQAGHCWACLLCPSSTLETTSARPRTFWESLRLSSPYPSRSLRLPQNIVGAQGHCGQGQVRGQKLLHTTRWWPGMSLTSLDLLFRPLGPLCPTRRGS